jgi:hypothetical protein
MAQIIARNGPGTTPPLPAPSGRLVQPDAGAPVLLYDSVTLDSGQEQPFKSKAFMNNRPRRIAVREMRAMVTLLITPVTTVEIRTPLLIALQLSVRRKSGRAIPITRGYVPVSAMCRSDNRIAEVFQSNTQVGSTEGGASWTFPYPIDLAPGDMIEAQVKHLGLYPISIVVDLSFAGADVEGPTSTRIPYVVAWQSPDFAFSDALTISAPPDQLVNDTGVELTVDRILGRFVVRVGDANGDHIVDIGDPSAQADYLAFVRMSLSQNRQVIRDYQTFRLAFGQNAALETAFKLAPGDYMNVDVKHVAGPAIVPFTYCIGRALVSLVGCREAP